MLQHLLVLSLIAAVAIAKPKTKVVNGDPARFTYTDMLTPQSGPCDVSEGPDNLIYIQEALANKIVRYNQHTGKLTEFDIPFTLGPIANNITVPLPGNAKAFLVTCAIRNGFDGKLYFSNGQRNQLVQFDVHKEKVKVFTPPDLTQPIGNLQPLNDITTAPDGVYFTSTTGNTITKFDYKTHKFTPFVIPLPVSLSTGIYYAADGGIWFISFRASKAGRLDRKTWKFQLFPLPLPNGAGPTVMRAETTNKRGDKLLWFAAITGGSLCSINQRTKRARCHRGLPLDTTVEVAQDYDDNVWITHLLQNTLGVYNPRRRNRTEIVLPGTLLPGAPVGAPLYVGTGIYSKPVGNPFTSGTGNCIWFTELSANRLVRYDLTGLKY